MTDRYELGARRLVTEVWRLVHQGVIDARSPAADAALDLRDELDPTWHPPLQGNALTQALDQTRRS